MTDTWSNTIASAQTTSRVFLVMALGVVASWRERSGSGAVLAGPILAHPAPRAQPERSLSPDHALEKRQE